MKEYNSMCLNCEKLNNGCQGTTNTIYSGCIYKSERKAVTIEDVKCETYEHLTGLGYDPEKVQQLVNTFWRITGMYQGKATRVITVDGQEIYL